MDTSQEYVKMCDHPEVQRHRKTVFAEGDFVAQTDYDEINCATIDELDRHKDEVWLPRLDQWIELIEGQITLRRFESGGCEVIVRDHYFRCLIAQRETAEQSCCRAYMAQQGFKWTGDGWEVM